MAEKEYIERGALIESLQKIESELEYADGKDGYLFAYGTLTGVRKSIIHTKSAPAADVVEVVRCKDCKHRETHECPMVFYETIYFDDEGYVESETLIHDNTEDNSFCSCGERKE